MSSSSFLGGYGPVNLTNKGGINKGLSNQYNQNQNLEAGTIGQRNQESGTTLQGYQGLVNGGGYSPAEKSSIEQGTLGGIQGAYGTAQGQAQRQQALTHNNAGYGSFLGQLARNKAKDLSSAGMNIQADFANQAYQRKLAGLQGLSQMYGVDTSFLSALGNQQANLLQIGSGVQARSRGVLGSIGAGIGLGRELLTPPGK